ncbi:hypothetical protein F511_47378 [Dorcoceras hygrometricum]|uniref:Uncharacterized protein n=1 Tax=Dorcoceras hygrometricum TaxID=472368 RepID=A0A2Z6ZR49_9LAMI|nr:hypothetical protein F511_47378 [Dorcoceras hygrometricum]
MSRAGRATRARWPGDCATAGRDVRATSRRCCESWPDVVARAGHASCAMLAETLRDGGGAAARWAGRLFPLVALAGRMSAARWLRMMRAGRAKLLAASCAAAAIFVVVAPAAGRRSGESSAMS